MSEKIFDITIHFMDSPESIDGENEYPRSTKYAALIHACSETEPPLYVGMRSAIIDRWSFGNSRDDTTKERITDPRKALSDLLQKISDRINLC